MIIKRYFNIKLGKVQALIITRREDGAKEGDGPHCWTSFG
jgi:hypothetical protein